MAKWEYRERQLMSAKDFEKESQTSKEETTLEKWYRAFGKRPAPTREEFREMTNRYLLSIGADPITDPLPSPNEESETDS